MTAIASGSAGVSSMAAAAAAMMMSASAGRCMLLLPLLLEELTELNCAPDHKTGIFYRGTSMCESVEKSFQRVMNVKRDTL